MRIQCSGTLSANSKLKILFQFFELSFANFSPVSCARIYRPSFRENKSKMLVFTHWKRAFWVVVFAKTGSINLGTGHTWLSYRLLALRLHKESLGSVQVALTFHRYPGNYLIVLPSVRFQVTEGEPGICPGSADFSPVSWLYLIVLPTVCFQVAEGEPGICPGSADFLLVSCLYLNVSPTVCFQVAVGELRICLGGDFYRYPVYTWLSCRLFNFRLWKKCLRSVQVVLTFHRYPGYTLCSLSGCRRSA